MSEEQKYYTLQEFSEIVGRSKGSVYYRCKKDLKPYLNPESKNIMISDEALPLYGINLKDRRNAEKLANQVLEMIKLKNENEKLKAENEGLKQEKKDINLKLDKKNKAIDELHNKIDELIENKNNLVNEKDRLEGQKAIAVSQLAEERSKVNYLENRGLWARIINRKSQNLLPEQDN